MTEDPEEERQARALYAWEARIRVLRANARLRARLAEVEGEVERLRLELSEEKDAYREMRETYLGRAEAAEARLAGAAQKKPSEHAEPPCQHEASDCPYGTDCPDHCPPRWDHPIRYPSAGRAAGDDR